ncbi:MAG: 30S ribosomal protein S20 [Patescibacteria group bacterium]
MAITKSAKKRIKSNAKKRVFNLRRLRTMRDQIKSFSKSVQSGDTDDAHKQVAHLYKSIDKAAKRGVIKQNTANRKKSRLSKMLHKKESA